MLDTQSIHSANSETTLEAPLELDSVIEALNLALTDVKETNDYLSYSTVLDIYLSEPEKYTYDQREQLLQYLLDVLNENKQLTYEVGWDLPSLLIKYVDSDYKFDQYLRKAPCVHKILKLFEVLALNGNPKELFLKCVEILTSLEVADSDAASDEHKEHFFDIKLYCIFELIDFCLKKIKTFYPSRFLSMTVSAYLNSISVNLNTLTNAIFMLRRLYSFTRNYTGPGIPENSDYTKEEIARIKEDEEYLQRKLITGFITEGVNLALRNAPEGYCIRLMLHIQDYNSKQLKEDPLCYSVEEPPIDRLYDLMLSCDVDLEDTFKKFIVESHVLFHLFDYTNEEKANADIFEKLVSDYRQNLNTSIINVESKKLKDSVLGTLILFTHHASTRRDFQLVNITFYDALVMLLRLCVPCMIHSEYSSFAIKDIVIYWSWYAIQQLSINDKRLELEIATIPKVLLGMYYQALLLAIISMPTRGNYRFTALTLLTRVLALSPENVAYEFIKDSLHNCPYENIKAALINVLKELLTKNKPNVDNLADKLTLASLNAPPPLPSRQENVTTKYLALTESRTDDIFKLINETVAETFKLDPVVVNYTKFPTLVGYLNFLVVIKSNPIVSRSKVSKVTERVKSICDSIEENCKDNTRDLNSAGMLRIAIERIEA